MSGSKKIVVAIFGPTGVGKTSLSLELAENAGEIISVDSMQVYKYLDIGTAKPTYEELHKVPHHLIDVVTPDQQFSAGNFKRSAEEIIPVLFAKNKVPFLVGGTGLYFSALIRGMINIPKIDPEIKECLNQKWLQIGQARIYRILQRLDSVYAAKIHMNDKQRTLRALEVITGTGKKFSSFLSEGNEKKLFNFITIGINIDRKKLYDIINKRVDKMIGMGLVEEVRKVLDKGYTKNDPGMRGIGYKEIIEYFDGNYTLDEAIDKIKRNSRRYAKRQLIWFRHQMKDVVWFENTELENIKHYIKNEINEFNGYNA